MQRVRTNCQFRLQSGFCSLILFLALSTRISAQMITVTPGDDSASSGHPRQYLLGDWGGARTSLEEKGTTFDLFYMTDIQGNPTGGLQQVTPTGSACAARWTLTSIGSFTGKG